MQTKYVSLVVSIQPHFFDGCQVIRFLSCHHFYCSFPFLAAPHLSFLLFILSSYLFSLPLLHPPSFPLPSLLPLPPPFSLKDLESRDRSLVKEGQCFLKNIKKLYQCILFNDLLVFAHGDSRQSKVQLQLSLEGVWVEDLEDLDPQTSS